MAIPAESNPIVATWRVPPFPIVPGPGIGLAVDIGTTTVAMVLVDRATGDILASDSFLNPQRRYGVDVISRINVASRGHGEKFRLSILEALGAGLARLCASRETPSAEITAAVVAGNTTMMHLLLGLPCDGLGLAPFTPAATMFPDVPFGDIFGVLPETASAISVAGGCLARFVPAVSAFIGGDVLAGVAALELCRDPGSPELFIDFGTNAEMALSFGGSFLCASAAAGPAFEGQSISCGSACVPGAVSSVFLTGNRFGYDIIGETAARPESCPRHIRGLCGSAVVDLVALGLELGLIRPDGSLSPVCESTGIVLDPNEDVRLLARDVREIQVARAAIRAAVSLLLESAGLCAGDVSRVYLAGGFGYYLKERSALASGLLPREFAGKLSGAGNTSLAGAVRALLDPGFLSSVDAVASRSRVVQLADHPSFNEEFVAFMEFDR